MRIPFRNGLVLLLIVAPAAHAGMLYKCSTPKGEVTIQSDPCPAGSTEIWKRDSTPAPQQTLQQVVANAVQQEHGNTNVHTPPPPAAGRVAAQPPPPPTPPTAASAPTPPAGAPMPPSMTASTPPMPPPASTPSTMTLQWHDEPETPANQPPVNTACDEAKTFANSVREKVWLGLTQDQAQRLYSWVMEQCDKD